MQAGRMCLEEAATKGQTWNIGYSCHVSYLRLCSSEAMQRCVSWQLRGSKDPFTSYCGFPLKQAKKNVRAIMIFQVINERNEKNHVSTIQIQDCEHCLSSANCLLSNANSFHSVALITIRSAVRWLMMLVTCMYTHVGE